MKIAIKLDNVNIKILDDGNNDVFSINLKEYAVSGDVDQVGKLIFEALDKANSLANSKDLLQ